MDALSYCGYKIFASPDLLATSGTWSLNIYIKRDARDQEGNFHTADTFSTRDEAVVHCHKFGMQIIDGDIPHCSIDNL